MNEELYMRLSEKVEWDMYVLYYVKIIYTLNKIKEANESHVKIPPTKIL